MPASRTPFLLTRVVAVALPWLAVRPLAAQVRAVPPSAARPIVRAGSGCVGSGAQLTAASGLAIAGRRVHRFTPSTTVIEHGDTMTVIHGLPRNRITSAADAARRDTVVVVFAGAGAKQVRPAGVAALAPRQVLAYRQLLCVVRSQDAINAMMPPGPPL